jgi:hypothetical protein
MSTITTTAAPPAPRFEVVWLADGRWTVVDLHCGMAIDPVRPWTEDIAAAVAHALNGDAAYAVAFRWTAPADSPGGEAA